MLVEATGASLHPVGAVVPGAALDNANLVAEQRGNLRLVREVATIHHVGDAVGVVHVGVLLRDTHIFFVRIVDPFGNTGLVLVVVDIGGIVAIEVVDVVGLTVVATVEVVVDIVIDDATGGIVDSDFLVNIGRSTIDVATEGFWSSPPMGLASLR